VTNPNGGLNDPQGESGLARNRSRWHRASFHRFRFENEKGTNPEELIAAAHAGCFTMALAFGLQAGGYTPAELTTEAAVTLEPEGQGFRISRSALTLRAQVPNLDDATFARMAGDAEKNCPVSKVLNAAITLDAKLI
jgi:osmotically inducible protein OsmC